MVYSILGAESFFPFRLSEDVDAGDVHLNYDRYGAPIETSILKEIRAKEITNREKSLFWPFTGQRGVTQPVFIPVNKTTEVKVCTADVIHS